MILKHIQKRLKVFSILSSLIVLVPLRTSTYACGWYPDGEEIRFMMFNPDLVSHRSWWNFFYSARFNYGDGQYRGTEDEGLLIEEWKQYTKSRVPDADIYACLFGDLTDSARNENAFYKEVAKKPVLKRYFDVADESQYLSRTDAPFNDENVMDVEWRETRRKLIDKITELLPGIDDKFLKRKYAFQLLKLSFYAADDAQFNDTYNHFFKGKEGHVLDWWAMHYKSVQLERNESLDSANFLHARVFSNSSNKQYVSRQWFSRKRLDKVLGLAQNDRQRADVLILGEVINPGRSLEGIIKTYDLAPDHPQLPLLVSREVNKIEDWLGSTKYINVPSLQDPYREQPVMTNWQRDFEYLGEVTRQVEQMAELKNNHRDFYNLTMAYLYLMKDDAPGGKHFLAELKPTNPTAAFQHNVLKALYLTEETDIRLASVQEQLGGILETLFDSRKDVFESQKIMYSLTAYLRHEFANRGLNHLAGLFANYSVNKFCNWCALLYPQGRPASFEYSMIEYFDLYGKPADVQAVINTYEKTNKNKLEELLLKPYSNDYYFYDLLGTLYIREGKLTSASAAFNKIPDSFWLTFSNASENLNSDPFVNPQLLQIETMAIYNKREIVERMLQLEAEMKADPTKRALNNQLLGNAWFNFSGKSWFMIVYRFTEAQTYPVALGEFARIKAKRYYRDALAVEQNPEMRSKLLYMAAYLSEGDELNSYAKQYEQLNNTEFYARRNCLTLRDLVSK